MEVKVTNARVSPPFLRLGLVVEFQKGGPVRFGTADLDLRIIPWPQLWKAIEALEERDPDVSTEDPLF